MYKYIKSESEIPEGRLNSAMKAIQDDVLNYASSYLRDDLGWDLNDIADMFFIDVDTTSDDRIRVEIRAELSYDDMVGLCNTLDDALAPYDDTAYFDMVSPGIAEAWIDYASIDFNTRYDERFGEPTTEVFTVPEFDQWMKDVIDFE